MNRLGIEHISVFGLPPVEFVDLAADLGCQYIAIALTPIDINPHDYPPYSLRDDPALRRDMMAAMDHRGVSMSLGEGFAVRPNADVRKLAADIDIMCELGAMRLNTVSMDPDLDRSFDQFAALAEMAGAAGLNLGLEFAPGMSVGDLPSALAAVRHVGRPNFQVTIDTMHLVRSGSGPADVAAADPDSFGYIQLNDVPLVSRFSSYMEEAMCERMVPGTGELPLLDILAALPRDLVIGIEVPLLSQAKTGVGPHDRLRPCIEAARNLLVQLN